MAETSTAPLGLSDAGSALWASVTSIEADGRTLTLRRDELTVLGLACRTADMVAALEAELVGQPLTTAGSKGQTIVNPVVVELRQQRAALASLLGRLAIPDAAADWDNLNASQRARRAAHARWSA